MRTDTPAGTKIEYGQAKGTVTTGRFSWMRVSHVYVRWDGYNLSTGYEIGSPIIEAFKVVKS